VRYIEIMIKNSIYKVIIICNNKCNNLSMNIIGRYLLAIWFKIYTCSCNIFYRIVSLIIKASIYIGTKLTSQLLVADYISSISTVICKKLKHYIYFVLNVTSCDDSKIENSLQLRMRISCTSFTN
jgi:hypothetical protein